MWFTQGGGREATLPWAVISLPLRGASDGNPGNSSAKGVQGSQGRSSGFEVQGSTVQGSGSAFGKFQRLQCGATPTVHALSGLLRLPTVPAWVGVDVQRSTFGV